MNNTDTDPILVQLPSAPESASKPKRKRKSTWKAGERKSAKLLKTVGYSEGERVPVTGRSRGSAPDVKHDRFSIEQKHRQKLPVLLMDAMDQAIKSIRGDQVAMVILHEKGKRYLNSLVVVQFKDLPHIFPIETEDTSD